MLNFAVIYSKKDEAGINIVEQLKEFFLPQVPIIEVKKDSINCENIDEEYPELKNTEFIIFATKHQSKAGEKSLSLHAPGNWRNADFGGKMGKVCKTSSQALKYLFQKLNENAQTSGYKHNITLECTHHGPLINKPCCFIELGSSEEGWKDKEAAKIVAKTISDFQNFKTNKNLKTAIAIGGPHYCPNFNKIQLNSKIYAISHIIPEYALPLNENMLSEAIEKTLEHTNLAIIDWKGSGNSENRQKIIDLLDKSSISHERTERIEK
ncbi:MAG: D-aminoacyl-tRNA deacylase [archaeon]|nr:D-aminoacyl-tRNA deacylase [archaeon]